VTATIGANIDYAVLVKQYGEPEGKKASQERRYSPAVCTGVRGRPIWPRLHVET
jgi:hypothetical protein